MSNVYQLIVDKLEALDRKMDAVDEKITSLTITSVEHEATLKEHERRSLANEKTVDILSLESEKRQEILLQKLIPIETHIIQLNFVGKLIVWGAGIAGFVATALEISSKL